MKRRTLTAFFCLLAALCLISGVPCADASEETASIVDSGTCGTDLAWSLDHSGLLSITGTGTIMDDYTSSTDMPWTDYFETITAVSVADGVTTIGSYAFSSCLALTEVSIPASVTSIGNHAFYGCRALTGLTLPDGVTTIGASAFRSCTALREIIIPDSVTTIGASAFRNCSALTEIVIPDGITVIGNSTFYGCTSLTDVTIPNSVTSVGSYAFANCALTELAIPGSVTQIGSYAFCNCSALTEVTIPDSVTSLGGYAFYSCDKLTCVTIGAGISALENGTFYACTVLTRITIPDSVTSIGSNTFRGCEQVMIHANSASTACAYAAENGLQVQALDTENLSGIQISRLPDRFAVPLGQPDFTGLKVSACYGDITLPLSDFTLTFDQTQPGIRTVTVSYLDQTASFEILLYDDNVEYVADFGALTITKGTIVYAAVYSSTGQMLSVYDCLTFTGGHALLSLPPSANRDTVRLFLLDRLSFVSLSPSVPPL